MQKLKGIVIEDKKLWLDIICNTIKKHFKDILEIKPHQSFVDAKEEIMRDSTYFDLLVTDVYDESNNHPGLDFVGYVSKLLNKPVIVVTLAEDIIKSTYKDYQVIDVFSKKAWDEMKFVVAMKEAIEQAIKNRDGNNGTNDKDIPY